MEKQNVLLFFGGCSSEYEVSLLSADSILRYIPRTRYNVICVGITKEGEWLLFQGDERKIADGTWAQDLSCRPVLLSPDRSRPGLLVQEGAERRWIPVDVAFPVLHGKNGEDGTIQGLFALGGLPFVGCGTLASAACMDKAVTHTLLAAANIAQTQYLWFYADRYRGNPEGARKIRRKIEARLNFPIFVKPANAGSSVGVSKVDSIAGLDAAIAVAAKEDDKIVVEEGVIGQEVECAVLGNREARASVVGEIGASAAFYDYDDKYKNGTSQLFIPARIDEKTAEKIREIAVRAYRLLGCRGLARVDFFVREKDGEVLLNEINTMPGFTQISMYPKLWEASGVSYRDLIDRLIQLALQK